MLKNKDTGDVLFVVVISLLSKGKVDEEEVKKAESVQQPMKTSDEKAEQPTDKIEEPDDSVD